MGDSSTQQSTLSSNTFVGRERELAELVSACEAGGDSDAHLFLIYGEPGIGKTRLADKLASRVKARGLQVLWGRCWEGDGAPHTGRGFRSFALFSARWIPNNAVVSLRSPKSPQTPSTRLLRSILICARHTPLLALRLARMLIHPRRAFRAVAIQRHPPPEFFWCFR